MTQSVLKHNYYAGFLETEVVKLEFEEFWACKDGPVRRWHLMFLTTFCSLIQTLFIYRRSYDS